MVLGQLSWETHVRLWVTFRSHPSSLAGQIFGLIETMALSVYIRVDDQLYYSDTVRGVQLRALYFE